MTDSNWPEFERLLLQALELEGEALEAFLREACGDDQALRSRLESVLESQRLLDSDFLEPETLGDESDSPRFEDRGEFAESEHLGKYRILRKLGEGGMATVYLAIHGELGNEVALKVLPRFATSSEERVARFKREAVTLAKLRHSGIVSVHDVGEDRGVHYLVMDYIEGPTYAQYLQEARALNVADDGQHVRKREFVRTQCDWIARIAECLHHAHETGIVHRDVKPSNIMLRGASEPLLTDFGVAKNLLEPSNTETGQMAGTAPYMSPEQARAVRNTIDPRSDVFSLGVVLYEALSLSQPFRGETLEESLRNVLFKDPARVDQLNPTVPRDLVTICHKAIEKDPQHRYSTAAHMAGDLRSFLAGHPILASPPSIWRRGRELVKRRRLAALLAATLILALSLTALAFYTHSSIREGQGLVTITAGASGFDVLAQELDHETYRLGERRALGETPLSVYLDPGHYRFTVINASGDFREASVVVLEGTEAGLLFDFTNRSGRWEDMILVEGGEDEEGVPIASFRLDREEVSNGEYRDFIEATGYPEPVFWQLYGFPEDQVEHPVTGVSWDDCQSYSLWAGLRLPTSSEWEFAMTRPDGRRQPWLDLDLPQFVRPPLTEARDAAGNEINRHYAQYLRYSVPANLDEHPTPLGFLHAASNVVEYTDTTQDLLAVFVRGVSWKEDPRTVDLYAEGIRPLRTRSLEGDVRPAWSAEIGFRCARSVAITK